MDRRLFLARTLGLPLLARPALAADLPMEMFKTRNCGCCSAWIAHIEPAGTVVEAQDIGQDVLWRLKMRSGITAELSACHTGFVEGYFIEGHVPAADVQRLLHERPDALDLTVPGTPVGSPGMKKAIAATLSQHSLLSRMGIRKHSSGTGDRAGAITKGDGQQPVFICSSLGAFHPNQTDMMACGIVKAALAREFSLENW